MKLKIWKPKDEKGPVVNLHLLEGEKGSILLVAVNEDGHVFDGGRLLEISPRGFYRFSHVAPHLGFVLEEKGKAVYSDERF